MCDCQCSQVGDRLIEQRGSGMTRQVRGAGCFHSCPSQWHYCWSAGVIAGSDMTGHVRCHPKPDRPQGCAADMRLIGHWDTTTCWSASANPGTLVRGSEQARSYTLAFHRRPRAAASPVLLLLLQPLLSSCPSLHLAPPVPVTRRAP